MVDQEPRRWEPSFPISSCSQVLFPVLLYFSTSCFFHSYSVLTVTLTQLGIFPISPLLWMFSIHTTSLAHPFFTHLCSAQSLRTLASLNSISWAFLVGLGPSQPPAGDRTVEEKLGGWLFPVPLLLSCLILKVPVILYSTASTGWSSFHGFSFCWVQ